MLSVVGLSDMDCPLWASEKSQRFYSDHQSTLLAIAIGCHLRDESAGDIPATLRHVRSIPEGERRAFLGTRPSTLRLPSMTTDGEHWVAFGRR